MAHWTHARAFVGHGTRAYAWFGVKHWVNWHSWKFTEEAGCRDRIIASSAWRGIRNGSGDLGRRPGRTSPVVLLQGFLAGIQPFLPRWPIAVRS